jgi:SPP1 family predicted phage head-tail adaptor
LANINQYRCRIKLYKRSYTSNNFGGYAQTWVLADTIWSKIEPLSGKEELLYKQIYPTAQVKISIRFRHDINPDMRILYNKKYYNILSAKDLENKHDELEMLCEVVQSAQSS